ncbi:MAG: enoyl-CoA hydratase [Pseudomonadota bacterium]
MGGEQHILTRVEDQVLTITLNRPDRLNAWTGTMQDEIKRTVIEAGHDEAVRCIVITGAGRGFCAGADMDGLQQIEPEKGSNLGPQRSADADPFPGVPGPQVHGHFPGRFGYMFSCPKPIIAAINGPIAGIGLVFALYADLRFAARDAKFTTAFAQRGLIAEHGISWLLPRLVGEAHALDLLFTARKFLGDEAERVGLVNRALDSDSLMSHVQETASHLATQVSPRSLAVMKRQIRAAYFQSFSEALDVGDREMQASFATFDFKEGVASFVERRAPAFEGR